MTAKRPTRNEARAWKQRREKALELFEAGQRQAAIARQLGVSRQCVHNWFWQWQGMDGDAFATRSSSAGRKARLVDGQWSAVETALDKGPEANGFPTRRWTLQYVAQVIEKLTGFKYHPSSVWRLLRARGWTLRLPPKSQPRPRGYVPRQWSAPAGRASKEK